MKNYIAIIGQNPSFIAFMAHSMTAAFVVSKAEQHLSLGGLRLLVAGIILVAAIKEFWYDLRYEKNPPQTFEDSLMDLTGYMAGVALALLI